MYSFLVLAVLGNIRGILFFLRKLLLFFHLQFFLTNVEKALPFEVRRVQVKVFAVVSCGMKFLEKKTAKKDKHCIHTATDK